MRQRNFSTGSGLILASLVIVFLTFGLASAASAQDYRYHVAKDGIVSGFFGGQSAGYTSDLSFTAAGYADPTAVINNHTAQLGDQTIFGWYAAGTELTFKLAVHDTGDTFYSNKALNADGIDHMRAMQFSLPNGSFTEFTPVVFLGFEDLLGGGNMDFNDSMAMFSNVIMVPVPEPSSIAMLLAGAWVAWVYSKFAFIVDSTNK